MSLVIMSLFCLSGVFANPASADTHLAKANPELLEALRQPTSLTLNDMSIREAVKILSETAGVDLVVADEVKGSVTVYLTDIPVLDILDIIIEMTENAYIAEGDIIRVVSRGRYFDETGGQFAENQYLRRYALEFVSASEATATLGSLGLVGSGGRIIADERTNALLLWDAPESHKRIKQALTEIDISSEFAKIELAHRPAATLVASLQAMVGAQARVEVDDASNAIVVSGSKDAVGLVREFVSVKDVESNLITEFIDLQYIATDTLLTAVEQHLTPDLGSVLLLGQGDRVAVTDLPFKMPFLHELILSLDNAPRQVLIDVKIVQVSYSDDKAVGINWDIVEDELSNLAIASRFPVLTGDDEEPTSGTLARIGDLDSDGFRVILGMLEIYGDTEIISEPRMLVQSGRSGQIHVGSTEPYVTVDSRQGTNGEINRFERVTTVDVGIKLDIRPTIHPNGIIGLEIIPEVSAVSRFVITPGGSEIPVIDQSRMSTYVQVKDGLHVVLGGLVETEERSTVKQVPILGSIPLLGNLFRSKETKDITTEIVTFLWPRIVSPEEVAEITESEAEAKRRAQTGETDEDE